MKKLFFIILFFPLLAFSQKQGNIWYFGVGAGLDFNSGTPVNITGGQTGTDVAFGDNQEGTSCISDSSGNILFYTGGKTIWNRNNSPMPNGTNLMGGTSSTQSSIIVPLPNSDSLFYVFTTDEFQNSPPNNKGYRYSVVDMCLNGGLGDVVAGQKNILLLDTATEKLAACEDASGNGYWIVGHKMLSNEFRAWHLTSAGITNTVISKIGTIHGWHQSNSSWTYPSAQGQMKISPDSHKLALAVSNFDPPYLDLFDFNNNSGIISNFCHTVIDSLLHKRIFGVEFSPDGTKLYAGLTGGSGPTFIYQYNIVAGGGNCDSIKASRFTLGQLNPVMLTEFQLATNGKIYLVDHTFYDLGCINYPNLHGAAADFDSLALTLTGSNGGYSLPNFVAGFKYHNTIPDCKPDYINENDLFGYSIAIAPNPFSQSAWITFSQTYHNITLEIYDIQGKLMMYNEYTDGDKLLFNRNGLNNGMYFLKITLDGKWVETRKMVVGD